MSERDELAATIYEGAQPVITSKHMPDTPRQWQLRAADAVIKAGWLSPEQVEQAKAVVWKEGVAVGDPTLSTEFSMNPLHRNPYEPTYADQLRTSKEAARAALTEDAEMSTARCEDESTRRYCQMHDMALPKWTHVELLEAKRAALTEAAE